MVVFMMCSFAIWNAARRKPLRSLRRLGVIARSVETGYAIGSEAGSNKIVVIPASGGEQRLSALPSSILVWTTLPGTKMVLSAIIM
jgi:hypothetical protein